MLLLLLLLLLSVGQDQVQGTYGYKLKAGGVTSPIYFRSVTGFADGTTSMCNVRIVDEEGKARNVSVAVSMGPKEKQGTWTGPWQKPCMTAMFGKQGSYSVRASLSLPPKDDPELCKSKYRIKGKKGASRWFGLAWSEAEGPPDDANAHYINPIVVVDRGSCMFEDKTLAAQTAGASAVIVGNNEVP